MTDAVILSILVVLACLYINRTDSYGILTRYENDVIVPTVVCENSRPVIVGICQNLKGNGKQPKWIKWTSNGQTINIDPNNETIKEKYSFLSDGEIHFYLVVTAEIGLDNDEDKYNCYNPDVEPNAQVTEQLKESAAILRVVPSERCNYHQAPTSTFSSTTQAIETTAAKTTIQSLSTSLASSKIPSTRLEEKRTTLAAQTSPETTNSDNVETSAFVILVEPELHDTPEQFVAEKVVQMKYIVAVVFVCFFCFILLLVLAYQFWNNRKPVKHVRVPADDHDDPESCHLTTESNNLTGGQ